MTFRRGSLSDVSEQIKRVSIQIHVLPHLEIMHSNDLLRKESKFLSH